MNIILFLLIYSLFLLVAIIYTHTGVLILTKKDIADIYLFIFLNLLMEKGT